MANISLLTAAPADSWDCWQGTSGEKPEKRSLSSTMHCLIASTIELLGRIFAGNNQATPTNPLISSVFLLEHRGQKLNSTLGSAQGLQAAAQLFLR